MEKIKEIIGRLRAGEDVEVIKKELSEVDPLQIPFAEQALVAEGAPLEDILSLCDLHVELFRDSLGEGLGCLKVIHWISCSGKTSSP